MLPNWDYDHIDVWGDLCEQFAICAKGSVQSPIDLTNADEVSMKPIDFDYHAGAQAVFNNGHTVQIQCAANSSMVYDGERYTLGQFHFHHPSEHTIDGQYMAMEMHLVHKNPETDVLAVVAVMIQQGEVDNPCYAPIFDHLPLEVSDLAHADPLPFDPTILLPDDISHFYAYDGSLTTPPCSENVHWIVLGTPVQLSKRQIDAFARLYDHNNRPIQPRNQRPLNHT